MCKCVGIFSKKDGYAQLNEAKQESKAWTAT